MKLLNTRHCLSKSRSALLSSWVESEEGWILEIDLSRLRILLNEFNLEFEFEPLILAPLSDVVLSSAT